MTGSSTSNSRELTAQSRPNCFKKPIQLSQDEHFVLHQMHHLLPRRSNGVNWLPNSPPPVNLTIGIISRNDVFKARMLYLTQREQMDDTRVRRLRAVPTDDPAEEMFTEMLSGWANSMQS